MDGGAVIGTGERVTLTRRSFWARVVPNNGILEYGRGIMSYQITCDLPIDRVTFLE